tara:strand:- start:3975 stop:4148 length:174 start_codon:yes stop_codon:yes gene_type:complete
MKVRFTTSLISANNYKKGQEVELDDEKAKQYIKAGYAIEIKKPKTNRKKKLTNVENR